MTNEDFSKTKLTFVFFIFEMTVSYFINGKKKIPKIQDNFDELSAKVKSVYKYVAITLMPMLIILMLLMMIYIKDSQGIGW
ncbi:hypothetical protein [Kangiella marina]